MSLPIAVQVYSVRDDAAKDFKGTLRQIKSMGYDGVEFAGLHGVSADDVKSMLDEIGLIPISAHINVNDLNNDEILADYEKIGIKYAAIPWYDFRSSDEQELKKTFEIFKAVGKRCKDRGIQLLYHNHDFEFRKIDGKYIIDTIYDSVPADLLKTELDTCWVNVGGENPADFVKKYSGRAPLVHLKDFAGQKSENMYGLIGKSEAAADTKGEFEFRPFGYGLQDTQSILDAAVAAGAEWVVVEQDSPSMGKTPMESIKMSIDSINKKVW